MSATKRILLVAATEPELCGHPGLVCGVGPVEAASATARALALDRPDAVLHVGVAGARRDSGLRPLELVIGSEAVYEDAPPTRQLSPAVTMPDPSLVETVRSALPAAHVAQIGTSARVGGGASCPVEAMEGFAVLRAAELAGVPAVEVRAIANLVEDDRSDWRLDDAIVVLANALPRLFSAVGD